MEQKSTNLLKWLGLVAILIVLAAIVIFIWPNLAKTNNTNKNLPSKATPVQTNPSVSEPKIPLKGTLYYQNQYQIFQYDFKTNQKTKIADGSELTLSPDATKLTYSNFENSPSLDMINSGSIVSYDLATKNENLFLASDEPNASIESWSPDGKYVIMDFGTSPTRGKNVLSFKDAQTKAEFGTIGSSYGWANGDNIAFTDINYQLTRPGELTGQGITIIGLDNKKTKLKQPDELTDYQYLSTKDGKIFFEKMSVSANTDWSDDKKVKITYWTIDPDGKNERAIDKETVASANLNGQIATLLPAKYQDKNHYNVFRSVKNSDDNTAIFEFHLYEYDPMTYETVKNENDIAVIDLTKPDAFQILFPGERPAWKTK